MDIFSQLPPPPVSPPAPEGQGNNRRWIPIVIAGVVVLLAACSILSVLAVKRLARSFNEPRTALNIYTDTLIREDYKAAYSLTSPDFRTTSTYGALVDYHNSLKAQYGALKSVNQTYWNVATKDGIVSCTIQARLNFEHGNQLFEFILHQENGAWRVYTYKAVYGETSN